MPCPVPGGIRSDDLWAGAAQRGLSCVQAVELQRCSRGACCALARHVAYVPTVWTQYLHVSSGASPACVQCARNGLALLGWKPLSSWESPVPEAAGEWFQLWEHQWACVNWFLADSSPNSTELLACLMSGQWVTLWNKWNCSPYLNNCLWQNDDVGEEQNSCTMLFLKEVLQVQNFCFSCS